MKYCSVHPLPISLPGLRLIRLLYADSVILVCEYLVVKFASLCLLLIHIDLNAAGNLVGEKMLMVMNGELRSCVEETEVG